jgi:hypothetical protein
LASYAITPDGSDGCLVAFAIGEYTAGENGIRFDGATIRLVQIFSAEDENGMAQNLHYHNHGYAVGEVAEFAE